MKYALLKAIDLVGLNFLGPVVRLCTGEEPRKQLKEIGQFIVVPIVAVALFLGLWSVVASKVKTKSGQLPGPLVTWQSASSIWTFNDRESAKEEAYAATDIEAQSARLPALEARLAKLEAVAPKLNDNVQAQQAAKAAAASERTADLRAKKTALAAKLKAERKDRVAKLTAFGASLADGDREGRSKLVRMTKAHDEKVETDRELLKSLDGRIRELADEEFAPLTAAQNLQSEAAEEAQFTRGLIDQINGGRGMKIAKLKEQLNADKQALLSATGPEVAKAADKVVTTGDRLKTVSESEYAKPYTLPMQIKRSVLCVFVGFLIGTAIAVPIGILCGLSKTFMAAMTPFIALFKPVSPIVWLPIALIVVGGFIKDPNTHPLMEWLAGLPLIGWMKINPAFIASAITVALCSLWATMTNTALGVASIDKDHLNVARVLKLGFWERLFKIVIPSALPLMFAGMRISLGVGWMVLIAAELLSSSEGIGKFVWDQFQNGASDSFAKMVVVVFVVGAIGLLLDRIMIVFQRLVSFDGAPTAV